MVRGRVAAILALGGLSLAATASAAGAPPRPYFVAATDSCLKRLPGAVLGLPPTTPPAAPAIFLHSFARERFQPEALAKLGAWQGHKRQATYEGITLTFFESAEDAHASVRSIGVYGGMRMRNVLVAWDQGFVARGTFRTTVLGCLRVDAPEGTPAPKRPTPRAGLATFAGYWGGHGRSLRITSTGRGFQRANANCCIRLYGMRLQILSVRGTLTRATAAYRVTSFKRYDREIPRLRVGQVGRLRLRDGIVTDSLTGTFVCSNPAWGATGACGA